MGKAFLTVRKWALLLAVVAVLIAAVVLVAGRTTGPKEPEDQVEVEIAFDHTGVDPLSSFFVPEDVMAAAKGYVAGTFPEDGWRRYCGEQYDQETERWEPVPLDQPVYFDRSRIESMEGPFVIPWRGMMLETWRINYEHHTTMPDLAVDLIVGGNYLTEDGWLCPTYPNCTYLVFTQRGHERKFLGGVVENDCGPEEDYGFWQEIADLVVEDEGWDLQFSEPVGDGAAAVQITGLGGMEVAWNADTSPSKCHLYFSGDWGELCPELAGREITAGTALWSDEARTAVAVAMNVDRGQGDFLVSFEVELKPDSVHVLRRTVLGENGRDPWDREMISMARTLARLMEDAEAYYNSRISPAPWAARWSRT